jgi:hypothetical protein
MQRSDLRWLLSTIAALVVLVPVVVLVLEAVGLDSSSEKEIVAVLTFVGVVVTACTSLITTTVTREADRRRAHEHSETERRLDREHGDENARLRLDAAMRAGALFNPDGNVAPDPASVASGLLSLTELGRSDLAVVLLVDLWDCRKPSAADEPPHDQRQPVSKETAVLVIDAALRSPSSKAQLVAAELLCRNSWRLDICQSLHWPSEIDGTWNRRFAARTKLLLIDALLELALSSNASKRALQSLVVRLYWISECDPDEHVRGCLGVLLRAVLPSVEQLGFGTYMQGTSKEVSLADLTRAAGRAKSNPDGILNEVAQHRRHALEKWAPKCVNVAEVDPGALAAGCVASASEQPLPAAAGVQ